MLLLLDLSALVLRCWFAGMGGQGFRATSVSWPLCLNTLTGRTSCISGEVVKTMKIKLMGSLPRADSTCLSSRGEYDTITMICEDLVRDHYLWRCAYGHICVSLKFLSWNIVPN